MRILVVGDEQPALEGLTGTLRKVCDNAVYNEAEILGFRDPHDALDSAQKRRYDIAFLDIEMRRMDGITLAEKLQDINPDINIVFTTGYSGYSLDAFKLHASGYITKPVTAEKVRKELNELRHPVSSIYSVQDDDKENAEIIRQGDGKKKLRIQTFGNFEVFFGESPVMFTYRKTKEMFAYLVDRNGAVCNNREIIDALWEDSAENDHSSYFKNCRADLISTLDGLGCDDTVIKHHGGLGVRPEVFECDYYDVINGKPGAERKYRGEYMSQFNWAEVTHASLARLTLT